MPTKARILIISAETFNNYSATGIILNNIYQGLRDIEIASIYCSNITPNDKVCKKYYKLNNYSRLHSYSSHFGEVNVKKSDTVTRNVNERVITNKTKSAKVNLQKIKSILNPWLDLAPFNIDKSLMKWISEFDPTVIYTLSGNIQITKLANRIGERNNIPIVAHFMDDWMSTLYSNKFYFIQNFFLKKEIKKLSKNSLKSLVISPQMAEEYSERFDLEFETLSNIPNKILKAPYFSNNKAIKIVYAGGLHLNRWETIKIISDVLDKVNKYEDKVYLDIYTNTQLQNCEINLFGDYVDFRPPVPPECVDEILLQADVLLHVESFRPEDVKYTRLSISTKVPQYLSMGKAVLGIGHSSCASIKCLRSSEAAFVYDEQSLERIELGILDLIEDKDLLYEKYSKALKFANENFCRPVQQRVLTNALSFSVNNFGK